MIHMIHVQNLEKYFMIRITILFFLKKQWKSVHVTEIKKIFKNDIIMTLLLINFVVINK